MNQRNSIRLFVFCVAAICILSCRSTQYVSMKPELDSAFQWLTYDEIVGVMGREPDSIINRENGCRTLVFNAVSDDEYFRTTFGNGRRMKGASEMYLKLLMNEDGVCYSTESNIIRRIDRIDNKKTEKAATSIVENVLYMFTRP